MILESLELACFGRFVEAARFDFAADRPNLVTGPNGSGKSTLLGALSAAFVIPHRASGEDIRRWQPWDRQLAPRVSVVFQGGGKRWRLTKRFLTRPEALLEAEGPEGFRAVAESDAVEEQLSEFLCGQKRPGVDPRTREWLAAGVLWVPQNALGAMKVEPAVQGVVQASFGAQTRSEALRRILSEAEEAYKKHWTEKGKAKKGSEQEKRAGEQTALEQEVAALKSRLEELDQLRESLKAAESRVRKVEGELKIAQEGAQVLEQSAAERNGLLAEHEKAVLQRKERQAEYERLKGVLEARATLEMRRGQQAARLEQLEQEARKAAATEAEAERALLKARQETAQQIEVLRARLEGLQAPAPQALEQMERLAGQMAELETKLESALLHAEFEAEQAVRIEVVEGEPAGWLELAGGERVRVSGSPRIEMRVPGAGRLRLTGPAESAADLRRRLEDARAMLAKLAAPFGNAPIEELKKRRREADTLVLDLERLGQALRAHDEGRSGEAVGLAAARKEKADAEQRLADERRGAQALEEEERRLKSDSRSEEEIRRALDGLALEAHGLSEKIRALEGRLASFANDLEERLSAARQGAEALQRALVGARTEMEQARLRLAELQGQAVYSAIAEKEARIEEIRRKLEAARLEAEAAKLLRAALLEALEEAESQVLPQVEQRATVLLGRLAGGFAERVALQADSWQPQAVRPAGMKTEVKPACVSGGEQEQIHLAVRLALADVLTENEPFPVVLDDALLATDDARLGRTVELIEERRGRMQFLILTCHPERFSGLAGARLIRLGQGAAAG
jgi:DNA repair exonuclease SbcCD ATPase subunit